MREDSSSGQSMPICMSVDGGPELPPSQDDDHAVRAASAAV
jgi:hypothetical protein